MHTPSSAKSSDPPDYIKKSLLQQPFSVYLFR